MLVTINYVEYVISFWPAGPAVSLASKPVSKFSDFKRYTKEQFHLEDHKKLATIYEKLHEKGCYLILTNSNSPEILKLYKKFDIKILNTKRNINAKGNLRTGKDIIVTNYEAGNRAI